MDRLNNWMGRLTRMGVGRPVAAPSLSSADPANPTI
jgi:hypothetical protein